MTTKEWQYFFYYGKSSLMEEVRNDVVQGLLQKRGRLFFNRMEGTIISNKQNQAMGFRLEIELRQDIAEWAGRRNQNVPEGSSGRDYRIALSQWSIFFEKGEDSGSLNIQVFYLPLSDIRNLQQVKVPL